MSGGLIVKTFRTIATTAALMVGATLTGFWPMDVLAAAPEEQTSTLQRTLYLLIGVAAVICVALIFNNDLLTRILGRLGHSSGEKRGPQGGEGAVIHHSSGETDFDGTPEQIPPPGKDAERNLKRSAD
jgi:uncharacterized membrane protein YuzA (DUF378 family)